MSNLNFKDYNETTQRGDTVSAMEALKHLYQLTDNQLRTIADEVDISLETSRLERQLLEDKEKLIFLATQTKCTDKQEIRRKIDFLNLVFQEKKAKFDLSPTDNLIQSLLIDCETTF